MKIYYIGRELSHHISKTLHDVAKEKDIIYTEREIDYKTEFKNIIGYITTSNPTILVKEYPMFKDNLDLDENLNYILEKYFPRTAIVNLAIKKVKFDKVYKDNLRGNIEKAIQEVKQFDETIEKILNSKY